MELSDADRAAYVDTILSLQADYPLAFSRKRSRKTLEKIKGIRGACERVEDKIRRYKERGDIASLGGSVASTRRSSVSERRVAFELPGGGAGEGGGDGGSVSSILKWRRGVQTGGDAEQTTIDEHTAEEERAALINDVKAKLHNPIIREYVVQNFEEIDKIKLEERSNEELIRIQESCGIALAVQYGEESTQRILSAAANIAEVTFGIRNGKAQEIVEKDQLLNEDVKATIGSTISSLSCGVRALIGFSIDIFSAYMSQDDIDIEEEVEEVEGE